MNKKLIIGSIYGGLGDHLQFSTLPELAHKYGVECYVSNQSRYRNSDIKKLVWDLNPYVKFTDEAPNLTEKDYVKATGNIISDWELKCFAITKNRVPKLYYKPNDMPYFRDRIVIDANAYANKADFIPVIQKYSKHFPVILNPSEEVANKFSAHELMNTRDIFMWVDIITSCKGFICQNSGGSVVLPCYNKMAEVYMRDADMANNVFIFDINCYKSIESI